MSGHRAQVNGHEGSTAKTLAIWEKGGSSALNQHTVVVCSTDWPAFAAEDHGRSKAAVFMYCFDVFTILKMNVNV